MSHVCQHCGNEICTRWTGADWLDSGLSGNRTAHVQFISKGSAVHRALGGSEVIPDSLSPQRMSSPANNLVTLPGLAQAMSVL